MGYSLKTAKLCGAALILAAAFLTIAAKCAADGEDLILGEIPSPPDNPLTLEKIRLGRKLFFDKRLSSDNSISCADCHKPELAFTDGKKLSAGVGGMLAQRNAPSLLNSAYLPVLMFDGELKTLEMQAIVPIQEHSEMNSDMKALIAELRADPEYQKAAEEIFGRNFDPWVLTRSLSAFERTLISQNSPYDQFISGKKNAISASAKRGYRLFTEELYCVRCHQPPHFTGYTVECNGLYTDYGTDNGRYRITGQEKDKGLFKVPSLRNIALTAPYMHDGSFASLDDVILHYESGGKGHPNQSEIVKKIVLSENQRSDLKNFLRSLTDTSYLTKYQ